MKRTSASSPRAAPWPSRAASTSTTQGGRGRRHHRPVRRRLLLRLHGLRQGHGHHPRLRLRPRPTSGSPRAPTATPSPSARRTASAPTSSCTSSPTTTTSATQSYLQLWKLMRLIKKYSDYIRWPIQMDVDQARVQGDRREERGRQPEVRDREQNRARDRQQYGAHLAALASPRSPMRTASTFYKEKYHDTDRPRRPSSASTPRARSATRRCCSSPAASCSDYHVSSRLRAGPRSCTAPAS